MRSSASHTDSAIRTALFDTAVSLVASPAHAAAVAAATALAADMLAACAQATAAKPSQRARIFVWFACATLRKAGPVAAAHAAVRISRAAPLNIGPGVLMQVRFSFDLFFCSLVGCEL